MSKALAWIRKSKGDDADIGLAEQRDLVAALADELAPTVDTLDLGVHTGFSSMTRDDAAGLLDHNDRVTDHVDALRAGAYDYLVAYDDRRICRDEYFSVIQYACEQGDAEIAYVGDVNEDDLTFDLKRRIERDTKEEEIAKARSAIERRKQQGYDHGRPKFGMTYDDAGHYQVPGDEYDTVERIFALRDDGLSYRAIEAETGVPHRTVAAVCDRREWYREREQLAGDA